MASNRFDIPGIFISGLSLSSGFASSGILKGLLSFDETEVDAFLRKYGVMLLVSGIIIPGKIGNIPGGFGAGLLLMSLLKNK